MRHTKKFLGFCVNPHELFVHVRPSKGFSHASDSTIIESSKSTDTGIPCELRLVGAGITVDQLVDMSDFTSQ